jgi:hypothetical protein
MAEMEIHWIKFKLKNIDGRDHFPTYASSRAIWLITDYLVSGKYVIGAEVKK